MASKKIVFTNHAKERASQRLDIRENRFSLLFEFELKKIFKKGIKTICVENNKVKYESIHNDKKIIFICEENSKEIIVNTIIVK